MATDVFPRLERPFLDGRLALYLSPDADGFPFADFAQALVAERHGAITQKLGALGMDEVYWDLVVDGQVLTLHRQHYLGVFLCASDEATEALIRDLVPFAKRFLREPAQAVRRHRRRFIGWGASIGVLAGLWLAYSGLSAPSGYAAAYAFGGAWVLGLGAILVTGPLLLFRATRLIGWAGAACGASLILVFHLAFWSGHKAGLYDWWGDNPAPIPAQESR
jgi:hypothetical protein